MKQLLLDKRTTGYRIKLMFFLFGLLMCCRAMPAWGATFIGHTGETLNLTVYMVNTEGQAVGFGSSLIEEGLMVSAFVLDKPAGAGADVSATATFDQVRKGELTFTFVGDLPGEYRVQYLVEGLVNGQVRVYTGSSTVELVAPLSAAAEPADASGQSVLLGEASKEIIFFSKANAYFAHGQVQAAAAPFDEEQGQRLVGIRDLAAALAGQVTWHQAEQKAILRKGDVAVAIYAGKDHVTVAIGEEPIGPGFQVGAELALAVPAQNREGRMYLPAEEVAAVFGYACLWA